LDLPRRSAPRLLGAALAGTPVSSPEYVKAVRPAVRLRRGVFQRAKRRIIERQHVYHLCLPMLVSRLPDIAAVLVELG